MFPDTDTTMTTKIVTSLRFFCTCEPRDGVGLAPQKPFSRLASYGFRDVSCFHTFFIGYLSLDRSWYIMFVTDQANLWHLKDCGYMTLYSTVWYRIAWWHTWSIGCWGSNEQLPAIVVVQSLETSQVSNDFQANGFICCGAGSNHEMIWCLYELYESYCI